MNIEDLLAKSQARKQAQTRVFKNNLRDKEYQKYYPLIKEAVLKGVRLGAAISILQAEEGAFNGRTHNSVWQALRRALRKEGIKLSQSKK